ncbi:MAG TPA: TetR/AcrR family transcriptional regulator [Gemmatimonadaceae bacterium]|nr:TetR/AcrR family transcriptional regulator [Gemmatimonadaceae bacterium]
MPVQHPRPRQNKRRPRGPRWRRLPEERPRQILDAAFDAFREKGLAHARLDDIARRAGVSKGTIYLYFPNKEELFGAVIRHLVAENIDAERESHAGPASAELRAYAGRIWAFLRSPNFEAVYRLTIAELHTLPALSRFFAQEIALRSMRGIARIVQRGISEGEFGAADPDDAARMLYALLVKHGVWCNQEVRNLLLPGLDDDTVFDHVMTFCLDALRPAAASTPLARHRSARR